MALVTRPLLFRGSFVCLLVFFVEFIQAQSDYSQHVNVL